MLVFTTCKAVDGAFTVYGQIYGEGTARPDPQNPGKTVRGLRLGGYEVQWKDRLYGTNSKGMYYIVLPPSAYYKLLATRSIRLNIWKDDELIFDNDTVGFSVVNQQFSPIRLGSRAKLPGELPAAAAPAGAHGAEAWLGPSVAWAQAPRGDRLVIHGVTLQKRRRTCAAEPLSLSIAAAPSRCCGPETGRPQG
jgi:hypothetical protein